MPKDQTENFNILFDYLGLSDKLTRLTEKFNLRSSQIILQENGTIAVYDLSRMYSYALGKNVYQRGTIHFKLKLEYLRNNLWIMVGILKADVVPQGTSSYGWSGAYGWSLGVNGQLYEDGVNIGSGHSWKKLSKQGDTVELVLDCDGGKLSLHLPTGQQYHIVIPKEDFM